MNTDRYLRALTAIAQGNFEANRAELNEQLSRDEEEHDRELEFEAASRVDTEAEEEEIIYLLERSVFQGGIANQPPEVLRMRKCCICCFCSIDSLKDGVCEGCSDISECPNLCNCGGWCV